MSLEISELLANIIARSVVKPSVLVVEDDVTDADLMKIHLEQAGCSVTICRNADESAKFLSEFSKDLKIAFVDLKLVAGSGVDVMRSLQASNKDVPVVIVTGYPRSDEMAEACKVGYIGLIEKPLTKEKIEDVFNKHKIIVSNKA